MRDGNLKGYDVKTMGPSMGRYCPCIPSTCTLCILVVLRFELKNLPWPVNLQASVLKLRPKFANIIPSSGNCLRNLKTRCLYQLSEAPICLSGPLHQPKPAPFETESDTQVRNVDPFRAQSLERDFNLEALPSTAVTPRMQP